jgi:uncharacterized circularly permuted ATP-grasp superfamily protein
MINLSRVPTLTEDTIEGRWFEIQTLVRKQHKIIPGALTQA